MPPAPARRRGSGGSRAPGILHVPVVGGGAEGGEQLRLDGGPLDEQRRVQVHLEGDRPARDQGHAHVLPVLVGRVLDHGPALQVRLLLLLLGQHQPVAGLPDRVLDDIAHLDLPLALAHAVDADRLLLRVVRQRQRLQRLPELAVHVGVEEADALHVGHLERANAVRAPQVEQLDLDRGILAQLAASAVRRRPRCPSWSPAGRRCPAA